MRILVRKPWPVSPFPTFISGELRMGLIWLREPAEALSGSSRPANPKSRTAPAIRDGTCRWLLGVVVGRGWWLETLVGVAETWETHEKGNGFEILHWKLLKEVTTSGFRTHLDAKLWVKLIDVNGCLADQFRDKHPPRFRNWSPKVLLFRIHRGFFFRINRLWSFWERPTAHQPTEVLTFPGRGVCGSFACHGGEWHAAGAGVSGNGKIREVTLSFQGD